MKLKVTFSDNGMINKLVLSELFAAYGPVENVKVFRGVNPAQKSVLAFVQMENEQDGFIALQMLQGIEVGGTELKISLSYDQVHGMSESIAPRKKAKVVEELDNEDDDIYDDNEENDNDNYQSGKDWSDDSDDYDRPMWS